jgi:hypothetical protein
MENNEQMTRKEVLTINLKTLKKGHRELDQKISTLIEISPSDQFTLRLLKKRKLSLKDQISRLEDELTPDIIA